MIIGVISDTHSTLHPRVLDIFKQARVERILHAGDVGDFEVIRQLNEIAAVTAVRGNVDRLGNVAQLPNEVRLLIDGVSIYMTHIGGRPALWLPLLGEPRPHMAICGHSHIALLEEMGGVLFLNPGAGGTQARFKRPQTIALLKTEAGAAQAEIINL